MIFYAKLAFIALLVNGIFCNDSENEQKVPAQHSLAYKKYPKILNGNTNITTYEGDTAVLPCEVANLDSSHVIWFKIGSDGIPSTLTVGYEQFSRNMRYRVIRSTVSEESNDTRSVESWNFEIRKVNKDDEGLYQCYIRINHKHKVKINIYVDVLSEKEKPPTNEDPLAFFSKSLTVESLKSLPKDTEKVETSINTWIRLRCNEPPSQAGVYRSSIRQASDIHWYKDGQLIEQEDTKRWKKSSGNNEVSDTIDLEFFSVDPKKDTGLYQCKRNTRILKNIYLHVYESKSQKNTLSVFLIITSNLIVFSRSCLF